MKKTRFVSVCCTMVLVFFAVFPVMAADKGTEKVIDWDGRFEGEEQTPSWLRSMKKGNGLIYCQEFGLPQKINRKWMVPVASESLVGWEDGLIAARAQTFMAVGQSLATDVNSAIGSKLDDGAKSNIQRISLSSVTTVTGLEFEGYYWYELEKESITGYDNKRKPIKRKLHVWYVYAFYSMNMDTYNEMYIRTLQKIVKEGGFSKEEATIIATEGLKARSAAYRASEEFQQKIEQEQKEMVLAYQRQQMGIQQAYVDQQIDHANRTMAMAEQNQRNQNDLTNRNASNLYNQQTMGQVNRNQIDNRNIDTQQQQIYSTTEQLQSRDRSNVETVRTNAASNTTQAVANSGIMAGTAAQTASNPNPSSITYEESETAIMNDALAFLLSL